MNRRQMTDLCSIIIDTFCVWMTVAMIGVALIYVFFFALWCYSEPCANGYKHIVTVADFVTIHWVGF